MQFEGCINLHFVYTVMMKCLCELFRYLLIKAAVCALCRSIIKEEHQIFLYVPAASSRRWHNECQIWPGGLQQFTEAHFNLHPLVYRGDVTSYKVCGGAEGSGDQPEQLKCTHTVLYLCGWSLLLLPHVWILTGNGDYDPSYTHTHTYSNTVKMQ